MRCLTASLWHFQVDVSLGQPEVKYVSQWYTGGEPCDLTGSQRQTEVLHISLPSYLACVPAASCKG